MKKTRWITALCLLVVVLLPLVGCGRDSRTKLYVLHYKTEYTDYYDWFNKYFEEQNPGVKVEYTAVPTTDFNSSFDSRVQSKYLDVFGAQPSTMLQGIFAYMEPLKDMPVYSDYDEQYLKMGQVYNESLGKSEQLSMPLDFVGCVVYYNKKMFTEYGWEVPTTYTGFIALCDKIVADSNDAVKQIGKTKIAKDAPILMGGKDQWPMFSLLDAVEGQVVQGHSPNFYKDLRTGYETLAEYRQKEEIRFNNEYFVEAYQKTQKISSYFQSTFSGLAYDAAPRYYAKGDGVTKEFYPMMVDGSWSYSDILKKNPDFEVGMFLLPATDDAAMNRNFATKGGVSLSVFKESGNKELAQKYIETHLSVEAYTKYMEMTRLPSVLKTVQQPDAAVSALFDREKYNFVQMYDSAVIKYMPIPSAYELITLAQGGVTPQKLADDVQARVDDEFDKWFEFRNIRN